MDFKLTKEQELLRKMAAQFAVQYCEPEAAELDETHEFLHETWKKMAAPIAAYTMTLQTKNSMCP